MNHKECRNLFVEALYEELSSPRKDDFEGHIDECEECRSSYLSLRETAKVMERRKRPEPTRPEWTSFWNRLEPILKLPARQEHPMTWKDRLSGLFRFRPALAFGVAGTALVAIGIVIGQLMVTQPLGTDGIGKGLSEAERILLNDRALSYLERSKVLLLGIVNSGAAEPASGMLTKEQHISRALVTEAGALKNDLNEADEQRMKQLIVELEILLLQIANLESQNDFPALEIVQGGVERTGILLKINLEQMRRQAPGPVDKGDTDSQAPSI